MPTVRRFASLPDVRCSGEALGSPVYWLGLQWAVTAFGVERRDGGYYIERASIHSAENGHTWEDQVCAKEWADRADFHAAMSFARRKWPKAKPAEAAARKPNSTSHEISRPGKFVACTSTLFPLDHIFFGTVRTTRNTGYFEVSRTGKKALRNLPAKQTFAVDVRELRGLIRILRQAEASAVRHGLVDEAAG